MQKNCAKIAKIKNWKLILDIRFKLLTDLCIKIRQNNHSVHVEKKVHSKWSHF